MELITSNKFASLSNVIFSEVISKSEFELKNKNNNLSVIQESKINNDTFIWYINDQFDIKDGDIVYCQTELIKRFFKVVRNYQLRNITLITNQSDISIDSKLYSKKPEFISRWFATNVATYQKNLTAIPLGINNNYMYTHPIENDFKNVENKFDDKENFFYLNFNINTRFLHRFHIKNRFKNNKKAITENNLLSKKSYLKKINSYKFIICPWGNGYDTHRFWEALYSFSIPVSLKHISNEQFDSLPVKLVNSFRKLDINFEEINNIDFDLEGSIADFSFWEKKIINQNSRNSETNSYTIEIKKENLKFLKRFQYIRIFLNRYKRLKYLIFRIYKKIYNLITID